MFIKRLGYKYWPINFKFSFVFTSYMTVMIIIITVISSTLCKYSIRNEVEKYVSQTLVQVNRHIDTYINEMIDISQKILKPPYSEFFNEFRKNWILRKQIPTLESSILLNKALKFMDGDYEDNLLGGILYIDSNYAYVCSNTGEGNFWVNIDYKNEEWYENVQKIVYRYLS
ncbi:MAG: hypothetical protein HPY74_13310 [Firmicutes bacterium]|nr:hypothetical protein [Bacillota bacterium]